MGTAYGLRVQGLTTFVRGLQALGLEVTDLKDAFSTIADEAAQVVAGYVPKRTGRLAGDVRGNRAKGKASVAVGRASVPYAGPINYGWPKRGIEPAGFFAKADVVIQPRALQLLEDEINKQIRKKGL